MKQIYGSQHYGSSHPWISSLFPSGSYIITFSSQKFDLKDALKQCYQIYNEKACRISCCTIKVPCGIIVAKESILLLCVPGQLGCYKVQQLYSRVVVNGNSKYIMAQWFNDSCDSMNVTSTSPPSIFLSVQAFHKLSKLRDCCSSNFKALKQYI